MSYHWVWDLYVQEETAVTVSPQICRGEGSAAGWLLHGWLAGSELCWALDSAFPSHTQWAGSQGPLCLYTQHCRLCLLWAAAVSLVSQLIVRATLTLFFPKGHYRPLMTWVAHSVNFLILVLLLFSILPKKYERQIVLKYWAHFRYMSKFYDLRAKPVKNIA